MNASEHLQQELIEMSGVFVQWAATSLFDKCTSQAITPCSHVGTDTLVTDLLSRKRKTLCLVSTSWLSSSRTGIGNRCPSQAACSCPWVAMLVNNHANGCSLHNIQTIIYLVSLLPCTC